MIKPRQLLLLAALALGACSSDSPPSFPPTISLKVTAPTGIAPLTVTRLELRLSTTGNQAPQVEVATVGTRVRTVTDSGSSYLEVVLEPTPFLVSVVDILLLPPNGVAVDSLPAMKLLALAFRGSTKVGEISVENAGGAAIRFGTEDLSVDVAIACTLAEGCGSDGGTDGGADGGDDGGTDAGPPPLTGSVFDRAGGPVAQARILLNSTVLASDADGGFAVPNVTPPYTLTAAAPGDGPTAAVSWVGASTLAPRAGLANVSTLTARQATMRFQAGTYLGALAEFVVGGKALAAHTNLPVLQIAERRISMDGATTTSGDLTIAWSGPESVSVLVASARYYPSNFDGGSSSPVYAWFNLQRVTITDGVTTTVTATNGASYYGIERLVTVSDTGADAYTVRKYSPMIQYDDEQISMPGMPVGGFTSQTIPLLPGPYLPAACSEGTCTLFVRVAARVTACGTSGDSRYIIAQSSAVGFNDTTVPVTLPEPSTVEAPPELILDGGAIPDGGTTPIAPPPYKVGGAAGFDSHLILLLRTTSVAHSLWTSAAEGTFPDLRLIDAGLPEGVYQILLASWKQANLTVDRVLQDGVLEAPLINDSCSGSTVTQGLPPGAALSVGNRVVELKP